MQISKNTLYGLNYQYQTVFGQITVKIIDTIVDKRLANTDLNLVSYRTIDNVWMAINHLEKV